MKEITNYKLKSKFWERIQERIVWEDLKPLWLICGPWDLGSLPTTNYGYNSNFITKIYYFDWSIPHLIMILWKPNHGGREIYWNQVFYAKGMIERKNTWTMGRFQLLYATRKMLLVYGIFGEVDYLQQFTIFSSHSR